MDNLEAMMNDADKREVGTYPPGLCSQEGGEGRFWPAGRV